MKDQIIVAILNRKILLKVDYYKIEVDLQSPPQEIKEALEKEGIETLKYFSPVKNKLKKFLLYGLYDEYSHWLVVEGTSSRDIAKKLRTSLVMERYKSLSKQSLDKAKQKFDELPLTPIEELYKILKDKNNN